MHTSPKNSGFTLIELLSVVAIIGLLMGMMYPVLTGARNRAKDAACKDLCTQVASAWKTLALEKGRLPSKDLLDSNRDSAYNTSYPLGEGMYVMSPRITSVLNWWNPISPLPVRDKREYAPKYVLGSRNGSVISGSLADITSNYEAWPADSRYERSATQKIFGVCAPWYEKTLELYKKDGFSASLIKDDAFVVVSLDLDGDGKVKIPDEIATDGVTEITATAAAWVYNESHKKILKSW